MTKNRKASVRIRMYRQGLGDCFLLTFTEDGKPEFNMMIDCGVLQKTKNDKAIMTKVVEHIEAALPEKTVNKEKKRWLDVVVLTHEHADHISGFTKAKEVFERIHFGEVWAAWLDDETHPKYKLVRDRFHKQLKGLKSAVAKMDSNKSDGVKTAVELVLHDFFEDALLGTTSTTAGRSPSWDFAIGKSVGDPKFFTPGKMFPLPGFDDIRIYILGPSEDYETFTQVNPPQDDTYRTKGSGFALTDSFFAAVSDDDSLTSEAFQPFEKRLRVNPATAESNGFFKTYYGFEPGAEDWRRIDDDWLSVAGSLALKLDSYTNNTCLVFAIEFVSSQKVLLFPGDAQFSNWLSWQKLSWEVPDDNGGKQKLTTKDLLERTVLYKVGHHGSHNATLKKHGLEMMTSPELIAIIPVSRDMARNQTSSTNPHGWEMPERNLFERLLEKTRGRVLLADESQDQALKERCKDKKFLSSVKFVGSFVRDQTASAQDEPLCLELTIAG